MIKKPKKVSTPAKKKKTTTKSFTTGTASSITESKKEIPEGAEIINKEIRTTVREIENGFIVSKNYDVRYKAKGSDSSDYAYWTEDYFTKEDPLTITINDAALADKFTEE